MQTMQSTASTLFSTYASLTGALMLVRTIINDIVPRPVRSYMESVVLKFFSSSAYSKQLTLVVEKRMGYVRNEVYEAAEIYLATRKDPNVDRLKVGKGPKQEHLNVFVDKNQEVADTFRNIKLTWRFVAVESDNNRKEKKCFELSFDKNFKNIVMDEYLPHIISEVKKIKQRKKMVKLYTKSCDESDSDEDGPGGDWGCITLNHPATFDTVAMEPKLKAAIMEDLDKFVRRRDFYKRVGRAWKRGYLLYGPPGTGKSSLIAAMANYLKFDIFDVELTSLDSDYELRRTLLSITNRSIVVIEDIDCNSKVWKRSNSKHKFPPVKKDDGDDEAPAQSKLTLSGILNFIDGLWSSSGDERLIVFTTNHIDKIDPALLRPGRMDMHIHMAYCTYESFKILASNYLGVSDDHKLFGEIDGLIKRVQVTPAEIAEELTINEDPVLALEGVVNLLRQKKAEANEANDGQYSVPQENSREEIVNGPQLRVTET